jgi:Flp pilus assembly secretin CpaC
MRPYKVALPRSIALGMLLIAWATGLGAQTTDSEPKSVLVGYSELVRLGRPAATVIVGDPAIAEVTLPDVDSLLLTGKSPGTTNVIVLDPDKTEIYRAVIEVGREINVVGVGKIQPYLCTPNCRLQEKRASESIFSKNQRQ